MSSVERQSRVARSYEIERMTPARRAVIMRHAGVGLYNEFRALGFWCNRRIHKFSEEIERERAHANIQALEGILIRAGAIPAEEDRAGFSRLAEELKRLDYSGLAYEYLDSGFFSDLAEDWARGGTYAAEWGLNHREALILYLGKGEMLTAKKRLKRGAKALNFFPETRAIMKRAPYNPYRIPLPSRIGEWLDRIPVPDPANPPFP